MQRLIAAIVLGIVFIARPAMAEDTAAACLVKLLRNACVQNDDQPEKIRAWAAEQTLPKVSDPDTRHIFIGEGNRGEAWSVPSSSGHFALSIRGNTEGCAVWAHTADPGEVEKYFDQFIKSTSHAGVHIKVAHDTTEPGPSGQIHNLIYRITSDDPKAGGFAFTMLIIEEPGNTFQATLQEARFAIK